jgi:hypothetical protein
MMCRKGCSGLRATPWTVRRAHSPIRCQTTHVRDLCHRVLAKTLVPSIWSAALL